jgi:hypothetical protein
MHIKLINSKMQDFKKRNRSSHDNSSFEPEDKENILPPKYEKLMDGKKSQRNYLIQAEKLIMKERMKDIVADNVQYFRNICTFCLISSVSQRSVSPKQVES